MATTRVADPIKRGVHAILQLFPGLADEAVLPARYYLGEHVADIGPSVEAAVVLYARDERTSQL